MLKVSLLIALAASVASAQSLVPLEGENAAPEPYSYGYETETHSASEQRDPSGKVTGYYTLADADGRQRRVEYIADEAGFRAKVQTNEVGTKSENSADVEVLAAPPTREQLVYQAPAVQQQTVAYQAPRVVTQQVATAQPLRQAAVSYVQQPQYSYGYGYYPGSYGYSGYGTGYTGTGYGYGLNSGRYGYAAAPAAYGGNYNYGTYTGYNNHLPSSYYRSVGATPVQYASAVGVPAQTVASGNYRSYQTVGVPASQVGYSVPSGIVGGGIRSTSSAPISSNYIVLKKRDSGAEAKETEAKSSK